MTEACERNCEQASKTMSTLLDAIKPRGSSQRGSFAKSLMTPVGFEPTQLALVELESTPLDHSGKVS